MRQRICFKIIRLAVAEILIQAGFEKSSEDAMNTLTDIFCYFAESKSKELSSMQRLRFGNYCKPITLNICLKSLDQGSYKYKEILAFLSHQLSLALYFKDKFNLEGGNLLQVLKILPQRQLKLEIPNKQYRKNAIEIKSDMTESKDIEIDDFMLKFFDSSMKQANQDQKIDNAKDYADLSHNIATLSGVSHVNLDLDMYERFLQLKKSNSYNHFENDIFFVNKVTDELILLGKKVVEREDLEKNKL